MDAALLKWMKTPEAQRIATAAKEKAWNELLQQFPRADKSKFVIQADFIKNHKAVAEVFLKTSDGLSSVFGSDSRYWSQQMKIALGITDVNNGFPYQLSPLKTRNSLPIPAVDFTESASSIKKMFAGLMKIYATPNSFFQVKLRDIFVQTNIKNSTQLQSQELGYRALTLDTGPSSSTLQSFVRRRAVVYREKCWSLICQIR